MIWRCIDDEELQSEAQQLAKRLADGPTLGLGLIKHALLASSTNTLDQQLELERDLQSNAGASADFREGVDAFMNKRTPDFKGE